MRELKHPQSRSCAIVCSPPDIVNALAEKVVVQFPVDCHSGSRDHIPYADFSLQICPSLNASENLQQLRMISTAKPLVSSAEV